MTQMAAALLAAALLMVVSGCSDDTLTTPEDSPTASSTTVGKYDQTWTRSYGSTTCQQYRTKMTRHQRFAFAAEILRELNETADYPPDRTVRKFRTRLYVVCDAARKQTIPDMAVGIWTTEGGYS